MKTTNFISMFLIDFDTYVAPNVEVLEVEVENVFFDSDLTGGNESYMPEEGVWD